MYQVSPGEKAGISQRGQEGERTEQKTQNGQAFSVHLSQQNQKQDGGRHQGHPASRDVVEQLRAQGVGCDRRLRRGHAGGPGSCRGPIGRPPGCTRWSAATAVRPTRTADQNRTDQPYGSCPQHSFLPLSQHKMTLEEDHSHHSVGPWLLVAGQHHHGQDESAAIKVGIAQQSGPGADAPGQTNQQEREEDHSEEAVGPATSPGRLQKRSCPAAWEGNRVPSLAGTGS